MDRHDHWENVYRTKAADQVSWFRPHLDASLTIIVNTGIGCDGAIIDVGGGNSTLVDDLLTKGCVDVSVLDISEKALADSRQRLGTLAAKVNWIAADITSADLPANHYDVWHDRAVFHFLTDPGDRREYVDLVMRSLKPGGHIIVASFGPEGPQKCSGLDVVRYTPSAMHDEFGPSFRLVDSISEKHNTPFGTTQDFVYCYCRKYSLD